MRIALLFIYLVTIFLIRTIEHQLEKYKKKIEKNEFKITIFLNNNINNTR